ncbi:transcriptional regulator, IclR family [Alteribacillus persepolensis]|uniref:Transcriptional regulator, IclR family n=1 Tax=Alteribacillus persepolensis TaxID=568899 RepID=A0A1G8KRG8_9BACI|nr:IclR family transcriptional regulator C-terminal domain-containing protein [Alteribacillus persepolensis]SDI45963.1 transcriptional regulator, IclR family [Alteribacillus persepolensis]
MTINHQPSESRDFIKSLEKGINVLKAFSADNPIMTVSEAAEVTGYSRPTVRRIFITLQTLGYMEEKSGRYMLTPRVLSLGYSYLSSQNIWNIATPYLEKLVKRTRESSSISVLDRDEVVYVARVPTERIMTISLNVGSRLPAYATSMGKLLLAYLPENERERYIQQLKAKQLTDNTKADSEALREELRTIKRQGWSFANEELEEGVRSIAVPIYNRQHEVYAAVNCSANASRVSAAYMKNEYLALLQEAAKEISEDLAAYQSSFNL